MAGSRGALVSFLRASGMPTFLVRIIPETGGKVQGEIELTADSGQQTGRSGKFEIRIPKFETNSKWGKKTEVRSLETEVKLIRDHFLDGINRIDRIF